MKTVYFATTNRGKVALVSHSLKDHGIAVKHVHLEMPEPRSDDLRKIAKEKVMFAYSKIKKPCIALDAAFYVPALNGFPGSFTNFALDTIGIDGILQLLKGKNRRCYFKNCLAYYDGKKVRFFEGSVHGNLTTTKKGKLTDFAWSKLWLIYVPLGEKKRLAEMTKEEFIAWRKKTTWLHSTEQFGRWFVKG